MIINVLYQCINVSINIKLHQCQGNFTKSSLTRHHVVCLFCRYSESILHLIWTYVGLELASCIIIIQWKRNPLKVIKVYSSSK